jgi:hypothetical protein
MLEEALRNMAKAALQFSRPGRPPPDVNIFKDPAAGATELLLATKMHLGQGFENFEPETIWSSFEVEAVNRDQLLAAMNLVTHPTFFWDYRAFGNTALAFGDHAVATDTVPHPEATDMAWAVFEAEILNALSQEPAEVEFDEEVLVYIATVLHEEGFIVAPDLLENAQEHLDRLTSPEGIALKISVQEGWETLKSHNLERLPAPTDALGVQLNRLAEVRLYLVKRAEHIANRLKSL